MVGDEKEKEVIQVAEDVTADLDAKLADLQTQIDGLKAEVAALKAASLQMPQDVKDALKKVLQWFDANV